MKKTTIFIASLSVFAAFAASFENPGREYAPHTWFHMIGGNVSKAGLAADLQAISSAGIGGIQFFHGSGQPWPRTEEQIQCLSEKWDNLVRYTADECVKLGLVFEMQNCPGWSMCGGPWITHDNAMRRLVCFEPGKKPDFNANDDYRELFTVEFPAPDGFGEDNHTPKSVTGTADCQVYDFGKPVTVRSMTVPNRNAYGLHNWAYVDCAVFTLNAKTEKGWKEIFTRDLPRCGWQDDQSITFAVPETAASQFQLVIKHRHPIRNVRAKFSPVAVIDNWQARAGWCFRDFNSKGTLPVAGASKNGRKVKLVFGHVNMKRRNGPAPKEATGWECDKLDPIGANATFDAYIGRIAKGPLAEGQLKGMLIDSWECGCQNWTWKMEEYFKAINGYELRPYLPVVFGYPVFDAGVNERFLRDWRRTLSRLVEDNFYGTLAKRAKETGLKLHFETAFSDVVPGDPLRYWKYADVPMCEYWQPHNNKYGYVGSDDFKPVRPCVSAAHIYGKKRVAAEALTSFELTWDENFQLFKDVADHHIFRGVTHHVFHTYTHNPQTGENFLPPGTSFGRGIGTPFLRGQTWWRFMPQFTAYLARCTYMLERGKPVVDVLWMLGDDMQYRPAENVEFPAGYKYDYCNADALTTRADVQNGRIVFPDGMSYTALWIPEDTLLLPETSAKVQELKRKGAKVITGELKIDWPSQLEKLDFKPVDWYQRRDGNEDIFFVRYPHGDTAFITIANGKKTILDPVTGGERSAWRNELASMKKSALKLAPVEEYPVWATERVYMGRVERAAGASSSAPVVLSLGRVRDWAEIYVNNAKINMLWCAPYVCDIAPYLKEGANDIKVVVTSTWFNRLVKDASLPENERMTWVIHGPKKDARMRESGLLGPVELLTK